ncbi:hypothetical protein MIR68_001959 [Amoeboaphelidium protococcarum]|nr:hypothetical protein MIR68_001959 [Amoeboaphelidium protococcarum]
MSVADALEEAQQKVAQLLHQPEDLQTTLLTSSPSTTRFILQQWLPYSNHQLLLQSRIVATCSYLFQRPVSDTMISCDGSDMCPLTPTPTLTPTFSFEQIQPIHPQNGVSLCY